MAEVLLSSGPEMEILQKDSYKLGEVIYEKAKAQQAETGTAEQPAEDVTSEEQGPEGEDVVDADFEVKE